MDGEPLVLSACLSPERRVSRSPHPSILWPTPFLLGAHPQTYPLIGECPGFHGEWLGSGVSGRRTEGAPFGVRLLAEFGNKIIGYKTLFAGIWLPLCFIGNACYPVPPPIPPRPPPRAPPRLCRGTCRWRPARAGQAHAVRGAHELRLVQQRQQLRVVREQWGVRHGHDHRAPRLRGRHLRQARDLRVRVLQRW